MRQSYLLLLMILIILSNKASGQTSTEQFETESVGSTSFTDNGVIFNIISGVATYDIYTLNGGGWNGITTDNRFIDNTGTATAAFANSSLTIKTTSNLFKVNRFWVYLADRFNVLSAPGTITVTGKLSGVTKFVQTKTTGFTTSININNGYTLIDLTNLNGQNYSNIVIDQLTLTIGGDFRYMALDAFTWVKDSGIVLGSLTLNAAAQTNVSCNGGSNGSATVGVTGGTAPYTYSWSPTGGTAATATGLAAGTYTVTVTDATNTTKTQSFTITQPSSAVSGTTVVTNVACNGASNGAINLTPAGGTAPYTFNWGGGITTEDRTGLAAGTYTVIITDANGCTATVNATVTQPTAISTTGSQTNIACNGASTGSATVTASGGTGPYTYSWSPSGGTAATATGLSAGTYTVTVTDANNCSATRTFTITQPTALSATTSQTNIACNGGSTGVATINVSGGTAPYTYSWSPSGGTAATATGLSAGTYTVTVTDANACTLTRTFTITQPTAISTTGSQTNIACNGASTGSATVTASGGTGPYTYSWSPSGGTAATATGLTAGTYTVTITDANNCSATRTFTITQPTALSATTSQTNIACNGGSTGVATINVSGGTAPYTYSWSPSGGTSATATGLSAGTYTVTVTDANACTLTRTFTITQPTAISTTGSQTNVACNGASTGSATVTASGGTGPYTYSWSLSGGTAATATGLAAGTYTVTITDANNCSATRTFTITQPTALSATTSQTNIACNGGSTGVATINVSGGTAPYTYSWSPSGGTAATATGLSAGTYTVTVTDANACKLTRTFTITQPTAISTTGSQTNIACNGASTGSATVTASGGTGPYTYSWSPSGGTAATATGLSAGTYTVTITDANNCSATRTFTITQPTALSATTSQTNIACNGGSTGVATINVSGGTAPYTYSWSPSGGTSATATGLSAGTYTVTVTDANACTLTRTFTITQPTAISTTGSQTNIACNGASTGSATVTASGGTGPYTYSWLPSGGTAATATGLAAGTYTVTITDANNCSATRTFTITQPTAISTIGSQTNVACNGASNGSATVTASGGTGPYTYSWNTTPVQTTAAATGLAAGTYTVTVKDANNCTATRTFTITQPSSAVSGTTVITNIACNGASNGAINLTPAGGTAPYTFNWGGGITTEDRTGLAAGTYTVIITDANGCTATVNATVTQPSSAVSGTTVVTNVACNGASNGAINLTPAGGTAPYTFNWGGGITTEDRTGLAAGTYTVIITDANGCTATVNATVTQPTAISTTGSQTNIACNGASTGSATVTASGGTGPYTYSWSPSGGTAATATGLAAGTYTVTITDANNCSASRTFTITQPTALSATTSQTNIACNGGSTGVATINVSGGTAPYTYSWSPSGGTAATATGLSAGTYTVTVTDANACTLTRTFTITQPTAISTTGSQTNIACNGASTGSATVTASGGTGPYTYSWLPSGGTAATATGLAAGTYTVTITDANNCSATRTFTITQPTALSATTSQTNIACNGGSTGVATINVSGGTAPYTYSWSPSGGTAATATGLSAGTYTVTVTDANACTLTRTFTITQPTAISTTGSQTNVACNGASTGSATVTASGGTGPYTYSWSPSGGTAATATGLSAGIYTVTITDANNCSATRTFTITQAAPVTAPTGLAIQNFVNGSTLSALVVNGQNIKWYASASDASNHINVLPMSTLLVNNTTYYATQTIGSCESQVSLAVTAVDGTLGVSNVTGPTKIQIYPNPVHDVLQFTGEIKITKVIVFSIDGRKVTEKIMGDQRKLDVSQLVQGTYLIQIVTEQGIQTMKFIKK